MQRCLGLAESHVRMTKALAFLVPDAVELTLTEAVLDHFSANRQNSPDAKEAGGQLFAQIEGSHWIIVRATGPRRSDWRSRFGFRPDRRAERAEIQDLFALGLHYVGDWHTHPEAHPIPSPSDLVSMDDLVTRSTHELPGFLMIIVGTDPGHFGLWVSLHTGAKRYFKGRYTQRPDKLDANVTGGPRDSEPLGHSSSGPSERPQ